MAPFSFDWTPSISWYSTSENCVDNILKQIWMSRNQTIFSIHKYANYNNHNKWKRNFEFYFT